MYDVETNAALDRLEFLAKKLPAEYVQEAEWLVHILAVALDRERNVDRPKFKAKVHPVGFAPVVEDDEYDDYPFVARAAVFSVAQTRAYSTLANNHKEE